jgi:integrase/recombinase XerD
MSSRESTAHFHSPVAALMEQFVQHKQACGYKYGEAVRILARFDRSLCDGGLSQCELPHALSWQWLAKQGHESASTHRGRIRVVRQFALYIRRLGYPADVPDRSLTSKCSTGFSPRILTPGEVRQLLHAVDQLTATARAPLRHLIMPEVFRLLYGCGFRLNEVLRLRVADVDLDRGIVTVREAKFGKDRLVPPASALVERLRRYADGMGLHSPDAYFFPSPSGGPWSLTAVYSLYRELLLRCGIAHPGRGKGPRVHDLRHYVPFLTMSRTA